jgi:intracellular multiplication protein IcmT
MIPSTAHWRDTARQARFFFVDARAAFPLLMFLMHISTFTAILALVTTMIFAVIERFGFSPPVALRVFRGLISGRRKMARPWWSC